MTPRRTDDAHRLVLLQILRALAAIAVLIGPVQGAVLAGAASAGTRARFPGGAGVDLFFAISGFIILTSSAAEAGRPGGRARFFRRRLVRLVPLYWLATLMFLPILLAGRTPPRGDLAGALAASLLFIPHAAVIGPAGVFPVYDLGWTLNFEMFFYVVFGLFLSRSLRTAASGTGLCLVLLVVAGSAWPGSGALRAVWTAPILIEFVLGLFAGLLFRSAFRPPLAACLLAATAGILLLALDPWRMTGKPPGSVTPNDLVRVLGWGIPAALVLFGAVFAEKCRSVPPIRPVRWLRTVGDASYSLYLVHPIVVIVLLKIWDQTVPIATRQQLTTWPVFGFALVAAALAAGLGVHRFVEVPLTRAAGRLLHARRRVAAAVVAS